MQELLRHANTKITIDTYSQACLRRSGKREQGLLNFRIADRLGSQALLTDLQQAAVFMLSSFEYCGGNLCTSMPSGL